MAKPKLSQQFVLLMWKNFALRKRQPLYFCLEIIIPLFIIIILAVVRTKQLKFNYDRCYFQEKPQVSMGPLQFARGFICTFNSTCYTNDTINWLTQTQNFTLPSFQNATNFTQLPQNSSLPSLISWITQNSNQFQNILNSFNSLPISSIMSSLTNGFSSANSTNMTLIGQFICGTPQNDAAIFLKIMQTYLKTNNKRKKRYVQTCRHTVESMLSGNSYLQQFYSIFIPMLFGRIYYTPYSNFTAELVRRANETFVMLDYLRLMAVQWRLSFSNTAQQSLLNGSFITTIRTICKNASVTQLNQFCNGFGRFLNTNTTISLLNTLTTIFGMVETALNCTQLDKFVPVSSADYFDNLTSSDYDNIYAGLVFDPSFQYLTVQNATFLNYSIRMPTSRIDSTVNFKVLDRFWTPLPRRNTLGDMKYYTSGFLFLQQAIDQAFIEMVSNTSVTTGASIQIMPYPCYVDDTFIRYLSLLMPLLFVISWSTSFTFLMKSIVYEKENRLKEFMQVMGLSNFVHWAAWFTSFLTVMSISTVILAIMIKVLHILEYSSPVVIFILLFSYVASIICQAFMLSVFFKQANIAGLVGGVIYFAFYLPYIIVVNNQDNIGSSVYYVSCILAQVSLSNALTFAAYWEQEAVGAQFSNLFSNTIPNLNFGVGHCIIMLWVDNIIYLIITWYVEAVFPGEFGIPKPWYFLFTKSYWGCCQASVVPSNYEFNISRTTDLPGMEVEPTNLPVGISITELSKIYPKSKIPAVDKLSLNFYQSQITAFLGHNGAGKTTTISILTGIYPPTSGTAFVLQHDIRHRMQSIRDILGLCPQHNILFDMLTVEDHVYFYGMLKGMTKEAISAEIPKIVEDVGLTKKINVYSKKLSGGMKRKLSVAMSFIGDSKVVFLDEPTAGIDPFARRGIWDLLMKYRKSDRTIVLTTHHMDEADYLSDRIAIISQGQLKCCGSSLFLKREFGNGYYLIFEKNKQATIEDFSSSILSRSANMVLEFVRNYIINARFVEETKTQLTIVLPVTEMENGGFSGLFKKLDRSIECLNMVSYGLSDTTLEEVFLKVADDPSKLDDAENLEIFTDNGDLPRPASRLSLRDRTSVQSDDEAVLFDMNLNYELIEGLQLLKQQILGLLIKRFHYTKRNIKGFISELFLPILLVLILISVLKSSNKFINQPLMIIHPWLMMPNGGHTNLYTFYHKENSSDSLTNSVVNWYKSDLGESGIRCISQSVFNLSGYQCYNASKNIWSPSPTYPVPMQSPECDCNQTGMEQCTDPNSGGPTPSSRLMESSDILSDLTGYNLSDHLIKKFRFYKQQLYGGYQFLLNDTFGRASNNLINGIPWPFVYSFFNTSQTSSSFLSYSRIFLQMSGKKTTYTRIWVNSKGYVSMPAYTNLFDNLLLKSKVNSSNDKSKYGIVVASYPFKYSTQDLLNHLDNQMVLELSLSVFLNFALSLIPASFVLFLVEENVTGSKRQQLVSGINPYVYWLSTFLWDIVKFTIPVIICIMIFAAFDYQSYISNKNIGAFVVLILLYGVAIIPHMYPFTFFFKVPSTAFVVLYSYNVLVGTMTTTATFIMDLLQEDDSTIKPINDVIKKVFLIFPQYDVGRGLIDLAYNYLTYNISGGSVDYNAFSWDIVSSKICSLCLLFVFWSGILCLIESGLIQRTLCGKIRNSNIKEKERHFDDDPDVTAERYVVESTPVEDLSLKVVNLTKIYNASIKTLCKCMKSAKEAVSSEKRKLAVNQITFGVQNGQCFGLLGVNGAGKTTTFKMLTGEEDITSGQCFINGKSIITDMVSAHADMGFCPQFDALHDLLTCEEELYLYCRIRGIPAKQLKQAVEVSMKQLSLQPHAEKVTSALSGGNKRKLSTAIALIGNPKVIFLDEPTAGMDAGARRFLWTKIRSLTGENNRSVVLTSHNMEECEVLCHKLCIMVDGQMKCFGSVQGLKSRFGNDYQVKLRLHPNSESEGNHETVKRIIEREFDNAALIQDENFITIVYRINPSFARLNILFDLFESLKNVGIISDFSISQTTLDEIFISFAKDEPTNSAIPPTEPPTYESIIK